MGTNQAIFVISYFHHKGISGILQIGTVQWWSVNGSYVQRVPCCASKWYLGILMVFRSKCWGLCWVIILVRILLMIICSNNNQYIYIHTPKIIMTHSNNDTDKNNDDDSNDIQDRSTVNQQFGHGNGHVDRGYSPVPTHYIYTHRPRLSKYHQKIVKVLGLWGQTSFL